MDKFIFEMVIFDGSMKNWRILNLNSGTFYSMDYPNRELAEADIDDGATRAGKIVKKVTLAQAREGLSSSYPIIIDRI